jgi:hypothetical protein
MIISGTINTLEEFNQIIEGIRLRRAHTQALDYPNRQEYYRGQLDTNWAIIPSIARGLNTPQQVAEAEKRIMDHFKAQVSARNIQSKVFLHDNPRNYQNDWAWLMQAQHYGIPTRMLDWSLKPEVALFFTLDNPAMDNVAGQFLVTYYPLVNIITENPAHNQFYDIAPGSITNTWFMNPAFYAASDMQYTTAEVRRARQHGKFIIQPYEKCFIGLDKQEDFIRSYYDTFEPVIEKYIIPAASKPQLRLDLIARGWHGEFLYRDENEIINEIRQDCKGILTEIASAAIIGA